MAKQVWWSSLAGYFRITGPASIGQPDGLDGAKPAGRGF